MSVQRKSILGRDFHKTIGNELQSAGLLKGEGTHLELLGTSCYNIGTASPEMETASPDETEPLYPAVPKAFFVS